MEIDKFDQTVISNSKTTISSDIVTVSENSISEEDTSENFVFESGIEALEVMMSQGLHNQDASFIGRNGGTENFEGETKAWTNEKDVSDDDYSGELSNESEVKFGDKIEIPIEPFNLEEEKELGHFDNDGNFVWDVKKKHIDSWLANEGSKPVETGPTNYKPPPSTSTSQYPSKPDFRTQISAIKAVLKPRETVRAAINRMSDQSLPSASARLAMKKAGKPYKVAKSSEFQDFLDLIISIHLDYFLYDKTKEDLENLLACDVQVHELSALANKAGNSFESGSGSTEEENRFLTEINKNHSNYSSDGDNDGCSIVQKALLARRCGSSQHIEDFIRHF